MKLDAQQAREDCISFNRNNSGRLSPTKKAGKESLPQRIEDSRIARDEFEGILKNSAKKFREAKSKEEEVNKLARNSYHTIKTHAEHFI